MTGNKKLHFQALIRTGYVKKGGTAYVKRNFNHPMYRSGLYEPDIYSHDFCPVYATPPHSFDFSHQQVLFLSG